MTKPSAAMADPPSRRVTPVVVHGGFAYISGQLPRIAGELQWRGKVGREVDLDEGREAARLCAAACADLLVNAVGTDNVVRLVKLTGFVASEPGFNNQGGVIDAASDLLLQRFGATAGAHARSAIGVAELPHNAPVEIEMIAAVRS